MRNLDFLAIYSFCTSGVVVALVFSSKFDLLRILSLTVSQKILKLLIVEGQLERLVWLAWLASIVFQVIFCGS